MQQDHLTKSFGLIIAFVVPGMVGLFAASFFVPPLRVWFGIASTQPPTVGGFLFVNVAAAGVGVFLSGVRWLVIERGLWRELDPGGGVSLAARRTSELAYQNLVSQFYNYYQFYANTLVALFLLYIAWAASSWLAKGPHWELVWAGGALAIVGPILERSARNSFDRFHDRRASLLKEAA